MDYQLSSFFGEALQPSAIVLVILCAGTMALFLRRSRLAIGLVGAGTILLAAIAWTPVSAWLMRPLENRFPQGRLPPNVTGIIVLGGAFSPAESDSRGTIALNDHAERMTAFISLARRYPGAELVFTGGNADGESPTEAQLAGRLFAELGLDLRRIHLEGKSRNTHENALFSRHMIAVAPHDQWILVTSAADMPRAIGCFRAVGWPVIPFPVDYHTQSDWWPMPGLTAGLRGLDWAAHEWIGLFYYRTRGWTSSLFPGPRQS